MGKRESLLMTSYSEYGNQEYERLRPQEALLGGSSRKMELGATEARKYARFSMTGKLQKLCSPFKSMLRDVRAEILEVARHGKSHVADLFAANILLTHITAAPVSRRRNELKASLGLLRNFHKEEAESYARNSRKLP